MLRFLARLAESRGKAVLVASVLLFAAAGMLGSGVAERLDPYGAEDPDTESVKASERLESAGYAETEVVVLVRGVDVRSPQGARRVESVRKKVARDQEVASVVGFAQTGSEDFISRDGEATYLAIALRPAGDRAEQGAAKRLVTRLDGEPGVLVGGPAVAQKQVNEHVESDLRRAELFAFPLLFGLSLLFFRSLVAALLPLMVGGLAIVATFLMLTVASELTSISIFALNLVTALGLGLSID